MRRTIAIIPARGGSKRLPRKNVLPFHGKPIIAWTIAAALDCACFARVIVSTEDREIASIAQQFGADVDRRNPELATDEALVVEVCLDLLDKEERNGQRYDVVACLYATAPLRGTADIRAVLDLVVPGTCDFALAVTDYAYPPHQALRMQADDRLEPMWPDLVNQRSEILGRIVVDNGSTYAASVPALRRHRSFYAPSLRGHYMPSWRSVDIDRGEDFQLAEYFAQRTER